jgi:hypothetical protein
VILCIEVVDRKEIGLTIQVGIIVISCSKIVCPIFQFVLVEWQPVIIKPKAHVVI